MNSWAIKGSSSRALWAAMSPSRLLGGAEQALRTGTAAVARRRDTRTSEPKRGVTEWFAGSLIVLSFDDLFVASSSTFVTSNQANSMLPIMA